jgi:hypothetical protein
MKASDGARGKHSSGARNEESSFGGGKFDGEKKKNKLDNPTKNSKGPSMAQIADMVKKDPLEAEDLKLNNQELESLPDLSSCASLKKLDVSGNKLTTLDFMAGCRGLTWLNIKENQIEDLGPTSRQFKMQVLNIGSNSEFFPCPPARHASRGLVKISCACCCLLLWPCHTCTQSSFIIERRCLLSGSYKEDVGHESPDCQQQQNSGNQRVGRPIKHQHAHPFTQPHKRNRWNCYAEESGEAVAGTLPNQSHSRLTCAPSSRRAALER